MTTIGDPDHAPDPHHLVLLRVTFGDLKPRDHYTGHRTKEQTTPPGQDVLIAGTGIGP